MFITQDGSKANRMGQGTWYLGENRETYQNEIEAIQTGIEEGMNLLDTAEMYGEGAAELLLGDAIRPYKRESLFIVSKVYPWNANREHIFQSCEQSLKRLGTEYLDLYLLHWKGNASFPETVSCMEELKTQGMIRSWGVSNLDVDDMQKIYALPNGNHCLTNQVLYHLGSRGVEYSLYPWMREHDIALMAYCPLAQAGRLKKQLLENSVLRNVAERHGATVYQILLAFLLSHPGVIPIPRSGHKSHTLENAAAMDIALSAHDLEELDAAFPTPTAKVPLDVE